MKKLIVPCALALAFAAPLTSARADSNTYNFCTSTLPLNFCGSVQVTATPNSSGGTDVSFTTSNTSSGDPLAVFTAIGINNSGITPGATYTPVTVSQGGTTFSGWVIQAPGSIGGGTVQLVSTTTGGALDNAISSACSGTADRIYTCNGTRPVTISFSTTDSFLVNNGSTDVFVNAAAENGACVGGCQTTTTPEPATLALLGTGMLGLGGPLSVLRRRRKV